MPSSLPQEHFFNIFTDEQNPARFICTNEALKELCYGWLYNRGLISSASDVESIIWDDGACYVVGKPISGMVSSPAAYGNGVSGYSIEYIRSCGRAMERQCRKYAATGGMHCSALFNEHGLVALFEDIGRHNTIDKLAGKCLLEGIETKNLLLVSTGRINTEIVAKFCRMGLSAAASFSAVTEQALDMAIESGIELIPYLLRWERS